MGTFELGPMPCPNCGKNVWGMFFNKVAANDPKRSISETIIEIHICMQCNHVRHKRAVHDNRELLRQEKAGAEDNKG